MLDRLDQSIPWQELAAPLATLYRNQETGRPNILVVMTLKCVFLQKWFNLSDPQLEECLLDRISFRRFVGLYQQDHNIDQTSLVRFRKRLLDHGHASTLKAHNRLCAMFRAMVEHPFAWLKRQGGFRKTRYRGLARNGLDVAFGAIAINFIGVYQFKRNFSAIVTPIGRQIDLK